MFLKLELIFNLVEASAKQMARDQRGMLIALSKLEYQALRATLAKPETLDCCMARRAISPRDCEELAAAQVEKRLLTAGICALRNHCAFSP
jgi:hypothetical protein